MSNIRTPVLFLSAAPLAAVILMILLSSGRRETSLNQPGIHARPAVRQYAEAPERAPAVRAQSKPQAAPPVLLAATNAPKTFSFRLKLRMNTGGK